MGTWIIGGILLFIVVMMIRKMVKDKKKGKSVCSCGGDCSHCGGHCH